MSKKILTTLSLLLAAITMMAASPKREIRSTWIAGIGVDFQSGSESTIKSRLTSYLNNMQAQNFTGVCFHVRSHADAYYKSTLEPWSEFVSGSRGTDPGWDPLAWMVEECHKRGMECYAWVNPFRVSTKGIKTTTSFDREWYNNGWLLAGTENSNYIVFNPGIEAARQHCLNVIKDIYTRYNIDGMLFDDYFYPGGGTAEDSSAGDYNLWRNSGTSLAIGDWRRENVNTFVKEVYDAIQNDRPDLRFGISPRGVAGASGNKYGVGRPNISASDGMYSEIYCDPLAWLDEGTIDFISPQIYWPTTSTIAPFEPLTLWYDKVCTKFGRHLYVSNAPYRMSESSSSSSNYIGGNTTTGWSELAKQVDITRENTDNGACGMIWYSVRWINGPEATGLGNYLLQNTYTKPALVPAITWKNAPVYAAPAGLKLSGSTLSWTATTGAKSNSIIRYSVYAVPHEKSAQLASGADGLDGAYLQGVTYGTSYTLDSSVANTGKYWYAVCVYDGYGLESEPSIVNYLDKEADAISLVAPADGSTADYSTTFSWTAAANATYTIEIALDEAFSQIVYTQSGLTTTSHTVDIKPLYIPTNAKCRWRVSVHQSQRRPYTTPAATFIAPERTSSDYEEGYIPVKDDATYPDYGNISIKSLWLRSPHAPYSNFSFESNGALNRGMTATATNVYISGRKSASASADIYLAEYDAATGAHIRDIDLDASGKCSLYPCNDVITDDAGNIIISNLTINAANNPVKLYLVNLNDGSLTSLGEFSTSGRIDHVDVYGDVTSDLWYAFAAISNGTAVARWTVTDGNVGTCIRAEITTYASGGTAASSLSTAPRVHAISPTKMYVDGSSTAFGLYNINNSYLTLLGQLSNSSDTDVRQSDFLNNGGCRFTVGEEGEMLAYSSASETYNTKWKIAAHGNEDMSDLAYRWTIPANGLGSTTSNTFSAPAVAVPMGDGVTNVYIYSPGNGLAAYAITDKASGVNDITADNDDAPAEYYTLHGIRVNASALTPGLYIRRQGTKTTKIVIR